MTEPSDGSVRISPQRVYEEVLGMKDQVAALVGTVERHIALQEQSNTRVTDDIRELDSRLDGHDTEMASVRTRLTSLEVDVLVLKEAGAKSDARKAPWWSIVAAIGTIITVGFLILNQLNTATIVERLVP